MTLETHSDGDGRWAEVAVPLGERSYRILVGENLLDRAGLLAQPVLARPRVVIVTDETVARLYLPRVRAAFESAGIAADQVVVPPGEGTKDIAHLAQLTDALLERRIERKTTLVALGGGVIGDLVGFAAAILLRGIDFVQIPTTLLAQVDSSVGGKTGINTRFGKNLLGAFHQPRLVLADVAALDTLPRRQFLAGYAEVVKYGLLGDSAFFSWLESNGRTLCAGDKTEQIHAVVVSCKAKAATVAADERESGARQLLNLGHTFGHALEAETGFGDTLLHGEAVSIGMALAFRLSADLGVCPASDAERARNHLKAMGLPTGLERIKKPDWSAARLLGHMRQDKKVIDGKLTLILARAIGDAFITTDVPEAAVLRTWERALGE